MSYGHQQHLFASAGLGVLPGAVPYSYLAPLSISPTDPAVTGSPQHNRKPPTTPPTGTVALTGGAGRLRSMRVAYSVPFARRSQLRWAILVASVRAPLELGGGPHGHLGWAGCYVV